MIKLRDWPALRGLVRQIFLRTRVQLTHVEWEFIGPYRPIGVYGPYPKRLRQQLEGAIWQFKTGGQWREMPTEFGAPSTTVSGSA